MQAAQILQQQASPTAPGPQGQQPTVASQVQQAASQQVMPDLQQVGQQAGLAGQLMAQQQQQQVVDTSKPVVVDGTNLIAGRVASNVAKLLRKGNRVSIVNCDKIMMSGRKAKVISEYEDFLRIHSIIHPQHGPFHPRRPDTIMKRMIRGMLPTEKPSRKTDLARLRTYIGVPSEVKGIEKIQFEKAKITRDSSKYTTMAELSRYVGGTNF